VETFETGLRKTIEWYLANQSWCKRARWFIPTWTPWRN